MIKLFCPYTLGYTQSSENYVKLSHSYYRPTYSSSAASYSCFCMICRLTTHFYSGTPRIDRSRSKG